MELIQFLELVYDQYSATSNTALYNKAKEILNTILLGETTIYDVFDLVGSNQARLLKQQLTTNAVHQFLLTKEAYMRLQQPKKRRLHNWSQITDRHIKFQMDLADIRKYNLGPFYPLTIIDCVSKFAWAFPIMHKTKQDVSQWLDLLFSRTPTDPMVDAFKPKLLEGKEFKNHEVMLMCKYHHVFQIFSLPYTPLGIIERFNQTLKRKIRHEVIRQRINKANFEHTLIRILNEYNTTTHSTTQQKPMV